MTKIALIADVHVANHKRWGGPSDGGINIRGRECVAAIRQAAEVAKAHRCAALFVLGDLFDHTRPTPPLVSATIGALASSVPQVPVHVLLGNHDRQSMHADDQACASMGWVDGITVHSKPTVIHLSSLMSVALLPYQAGEAKDWVTDGLAAVANTWLTPTRIVLTHCGIWDDDTPPYLKAAKDAIGIGHVRWLCDAHKVNLFAAGNWHECRSWRPRQGTSDPLVVIPGTLCPHNFSDPEEHGLVMIYDSLSSSWSTVAIPSPFFLKICSEDLGNWHNGVFDVIAEQLRHHYDAHGSARAYVRITACGPAQVLRAQEVRADIAARWPRTIVHIEAEEGFAAEVVRDAAKAAVAAGHSEAALLDYADLATVAEPGTRDGVVRRLSEYRKEAG